MSRGGYLQPLPFAGKLRPPRLSNGWYLAQHADFLDPRLPLQVRPGPEVRRRWAKAALPTAGAPGAAPQYYLGTGRSDCPFVDPLLRPAIHSQSEFARRRTGDQRTDRMQCLCRGSRGAAGRAILTPGAVVWHTFSACLPACRCCTCWVPRRGWRSCTPRRSCTVTSRPPTWCARRP